MADQIQNYLRNQMPVWKEQYRGAEEMKVAVMGCVVNGPGECRDADVGIACGRGKGALFIKGHVVRSIEESELLPALSGELARLAG
jgi:4-hydroxy-3-methylbut-2-en-1-yl diphosphate synthase IspG/GcpE